MRSNCGSINVAHSCCVLLTLWRWKFRWYNCSIWWRNTWQVQDSATHTEGKNVKYKEVVLLENNNNKKTGYHAECHRKFTALGRNATPKNDNVESKSVHTRSKSTLGSGSSSTGIMPKICIFCNNKDKKHNGSKPKLISVEKGDQEICNNPKGIKHYYPHWEALILSPKKYAIMGYAERSIRHLQSKNKPK